MDPMNHGVSSGAMALMFAALPNVPYQPRRAAAASRQLQALVRQPHIRGT